MKPQVGFENSILQEVYVEVTAVVPPAALLSLLVSKSPPRTRTVRNSFPLESCQDR